MSHAPQTEHWNSRLGAVLAVAGTAVGLGNFLRFPGLAAQYGGGAFMIAYFCAFILLGVPLCWMEWAIGRRGGALGGHSSASIFMLISRSSVWKYLGVLAVVAPLGVSVFYMFIEAWTLGYAWHTAMGDLNLGSPREFSDFFATYTGTVYDGAALELERSTVLLFFFIATIANFWLLYNGLSKGIERFCKIGMPLLLAISLLLLVRVLTLGTPDAAHPERSVNEGLGYMWNPNKTLLVADLGDKREKPLAMVPEDATEAERAALAARTAAEYPEATNLREKRITISQGLTNPELWLTAAGQIFFSLSVGFGIIISYASYVGRKEDIALSSLTAAATNEVVEVGIAGMMIVPAAVSLLGGAAAAGVSSFGLGFEVLPQVFACMPGGQLFGTLFFGVLFLAGITSSIASTRPSMAFVEEFWGLSRRQSVMLIAFIQTAGTLLVLWYTGEGLMALNTFDFWVGTLGLFVTSALTIITFRCIWGTKLGLAELNRGTMLKLPRGVAFIINWVTPLFFTAILVSWLYSNIFGTPSEHIMNLMEGKPGALYSMLWVGGCLLFMLAVVYTSRRFRLPAAQDKQEPRP